MKAASINKLRKELEKELAELVEQRDQLNVRILQTMSRLKNLRAVLAIDEGTAQTIREKGITGIGLTEAVRLVMRTSTAQPVQTANVVLAVLRAMGFDFSEYSNPSAAVHTTLKRLAEAGELVYTPTNKGYRSRNVPF